MNITNILNKSCFQPLLIKSRQFANVFGQQKCNNLLPTALMAMNKLNASNSQLFSLYEEYIPKLQLKDPVDPSMIINNKNWKDHLGQFKYNSEYQLFFNDLINKDGYQKVLQNYLPSLLLTPGCSLFHPLIRLGYAVEIEDLWEISDALAYWCDSYKQLAQLQDEKPKIYDNIQQAFQAISKNYVMKELEPQGSNIRTKLQHIARNEEFLEKFNDSVNFQQTTTKDLVDVALKAYISSKDKITMLHCLTGTQALLEILPFLREKQDQERSLRSWGQMLSAAYIHEDCFDINWNPKEPNERNIPTWQEIINEAKQSPDVHVIKMVYSTHRLKDICNPVLCRMAAAKKVAKY